MPYSMGLSSCFNLPLAPAEAAAATALSGGAEM